MGVFVVIKSHMFSHLVWASDICCILTLHRNQSAACSDYVLSELQRIGTAQSCLSTCPLAHQFDRACTLWCFHFTPSGDSHRKRPISDCPASCTPRPGAKEKNGTEERAAPKLTVWTSCWHNMTELSVSQHSHSWQMNAISTLLETQQPLTLYFTQQGHASSLKVCCCD